MDGPQGQDQTVLQGRGLQLEVELAAEALAQGEAEGAVEARAVGAVDHQMRIAHLIDEALQDQVAPSRQRAQGGIGGARYWAS